MAETGKKPLVNLADVASFPFGNGEGYAATLGMVGKAIGSEKLGAMLTVVEPGKAAFPHHVHHTNEEMFIILEGEGTYRFGDQRYPVKTGDVLAAPPGGPERAHQILNTGSQTLKYLSISTKIDTEVVEYPDSGKFAVMSRFDWDNPGAGGVRYIGRTDTSLDYWDGENANPVKD